MRVHLSRAVLLTALSSACGGDVGADPEGLVRHDSAGVEIVEASEAVLAALPRLSVSDSAGLRIGVLEGDDPYMFGAARFVHQLSDGTILVEDGQEREIRLFDAGGRFLRSLGGQGDGPGEFQYIGGLAVIPGDTLVIWDPAALRITRMTPSGEVAGTGTLAGYLPNVSWQGALPGGSVVLRMTWLSSASPDANRRYLLRISPDGERIDTLIDEPLPGEENMAFGSPRFDQPVFEPGPSWAVDGQDLWHAPGGWWEVERMDTTLSVEFAFRGGLPRRPVTREFFEWYADSTSFQGPWPLHERDEIRRIFDRRPVRDSLPSVSDLEIGADGRIWLRRWKFDGEGGDWEWLVIGGDGVPEAWVRIPRSFTPWRFDADEILGVARDSLGVQRVERRALTPDTSYAG